MRQLVREREKKKRGIEMRNTAKTDRQTDRQTNTKRERESV